MKRAELNAYWMVRSAHKWTWNEHTKKLWETVWDEDRISALCAVRSCACPLVRWTLTTIKIVASAKGTYSREMCARNQDESHFICNKWTTEKWGKKNFVSAVASFDVVILAFFYCWKTKRHMHPIIICVISVSYLFDIHTHTNTYMGRETNEMKMEL